jgi:hypothetical protein
MSPLVMSSRQRPSTWSTADATALSITRGKRAKLGMVRTLRSFEKYGLCMGMYLGTANWSCGGSRPGAQPTASDAHIGAWAFVSRCSAGTPSKKWPKPKVTEAHTIGRLDTGISLWPKKRPLSAHIYRINRFLVPCHSLTGQVRSSKPS